MQSTHEIKQTTREECCWGSIEIVSSLSSVSTLYALTVKYYSPLPSPTPSPPQLNDFTREILSLSFQMKIFSRKEKEVAIRQGKC